MSSIEGGTAVGSAPSGQTTGTPPQMYPPPPPGYGYYAPQRPSWSRMIETKPFFLTSEFFAPLLAIIAMAIAVSSADNFDSPRFWTLLTVLVSAYVVSRGIAKSGTKSRASDPREDMDLFNRGGDGGQR